MGGGKIKNTAGFPTQGVPGSDTPLARKLRGLRQVQPLPPIAQPIQPIPALQTASPFSGGNRKTLNIPGAPTLPDNPFADAAWRRGIKEGRHVGLDFYDLLIEEALIDGF